MKALSPQGESRATRQPAGAPLFSASVSARALRRAQRALLRELTQKPAGQAATGAAPAAEQSRLANPSPSGGTMRRTLHRLLAQAGYRAERGPRPTLLAAAPPSNGTAAQVFAIQHPSAERNTATTGGQA